MTSSLVDFALQEEYQKIKQLGDKLAEIEPMIDWSAFVPIVQDLFDNKTEKGGRPNFDETMMVKILVLQAWHNLSDEELERQVTDRISFRKFLGFPAKIPDYSTVWTFRERLKESGKDKQIWAELQRQLDAKGLNVKKGVIQDASFITTDPGHAKADEPRGDDAKTRRCKDGDWAKKGNKSFFGYKHHTKEDVDYGLIREIKTTAASVHDSQVDLTKPGEVAYRDKGYQGAPCAGYNATMKRAARGRPLGIRDILRNKRISRTRSPGERPYAVIKRVFGGAHTLVTTAARAGVKMLFASFSFNLYQLRTLKKQGAW